MGASPYWYVVPYNPNVDAALEELRQREFRAGRYNPVDPFRFIIYSQWAGAGLQPVGDAARDAR